MKAFEIMINEVFRVRENDSIRIVIETFINKRISGLPVINAKNEVVGYISDGDIMRYTCKNNDRIIDTSYYIFLFKGDCFLERTKKILDLNVMEIASKKVIKVSWDEDIENISSILVKKTLKKLPVERDGKIVGIISRGDVIRHSFEALL